jgi:hypothetical protein
VQILVQQKKTFEKNVKLIGAFVSKGKKIGHLCTSKYGIIFFIGKMRVKLSNFIVIHKKIYSKKIYSNFELMTSHSEDIVCCH